MNWDTHSWLLEMLNFKYKTVTETRLRFQQIYKDKKH